MCPSSFLCPVCPTCLLYHRHIKNIIIKKVKNDNLTKMGISIEKSEQTLILKMGIKKGRICAPWVSLYGFPASFHFIHNGYQ